MFLLRYSTESNKLNRNAMQKIFLPPLFPFCLLLKEHVLDHALFSVFAQLLHASLSLYGYGKKEKTLYDDCPPVSCLLILTLPSKTQSIVPTFLKSDNKGGRKWQVLSPALPGVMMYTFQSQSSINKVRHNRQRCFPWL